MPIGARTQGSAAIGVMTPASPGAPADSGVIQTKPGTMTWVIASNSHATDTFYLLFFNAIAVPGAGTATNMVAIPVLAQTAVFLPVPKQFTTGIVWACSSTPATLTASGLNAAQVQVGVL